jgi:two-component system cell cycle response regulator
LHVVVELVESSRLNDTVRILVVDDEHANRLLLKMTLSDYEVLTAATGHEMWQVLETVRPSLILLDVEMPGEDGFTLARQLAEIDSTTDIPVVFVTARDAPEDVDDGFRFGGYDYIKKPFDKVELRARVRAVLSKKRRELELKNQSITDHLTGLHNRRYLLQKGDQLIEYAKRTRNPLAAAMLDIDLFKRINDAHGHPSGDEVLKRFAAVMSKNIRPYDILARYGGEEFVILFIDTNKNTAQGILARLREEIAATAVSSGETEITFTFSGGVAEIDELPPDDISADTLIELADSRMYAAKAAGRNRIVSS